MYKHPLQLVTNTDIMDFVKTVSEEKGEVKLIDGNGFCVNGKSLLGALATVEWSSLFCVSENDIYTSIQRFCAE